MGADFQKWLTSFLGRYTGSLRALARELKITETSIMAWRDGRSTPGFDLIPRLAELLAELSGEDPKALHDMILAAKTERAQARRRRWQAPPGPSATVRKPLAASRFSSRLLRPAQPAAAV